MQVGKSFIKFIIVIVLLIGIIIWGAQSILKEVDHKEIEHIYTNMLLVQGKAKVVFETYHVDNANGLEGKKVEDNAQLELFEVNSDEIYYIWDNEVLDEVGLTEAKLEEDNFYAVNYDTEEVIYSTGYQTKDGDVYYKLSEIKGLINQ